MVPTSVEPFRGLICHIQNRDPDDDTVKVGGDLLQVPNFENLGNIGEDISGAIYSAKKKQSIVQQCTRDSVLLLSIRELGQVSEGPV